MLVLHCSPPSVATHQNKLCPGAVLARMVYLPLYMRLIAARSACPGCDQTLRAPVGARVLGCHWIVVDREYNWDRRGRGLGSVGCVESAADDDGHMPGHQFCGERR